VSEIDMTKDHMLAELNFARQRIAELESQNLAMSEISRLGSLQVKSKLK
jgi:hypothetical protein